MSNIKIDQLSFGFDTQNHLLFDQADLVIDTQWKLGLIGRNGRGKLLYSNYCKTNCLIAGLSPISKHSFTFLNQWQIRNN